MTVSAAFAGPTRAALERELQLSRELAGIMRETGSFAVALTDCLARTCEATAWELGQVWIPSSQDAETLHSSVGWASDATLEPFLVTTGTPALENNCLPARAWAGCAPVWVTDIQSCEFFARRKAAAAVGLASAAAVPVLAAGEPVAVLEFFTRERREQEDETMRLLTDVACHIGPAVRLKTAEERLVDSESRFRTLAETAGDAIVSVDRSGRLIYLNPTAQKMFGYPGGEALGRPLTLLLAEPVPSPQGTGFEESATIHDARRLGEIVDLTGRRANGDEFPIELSLGAHGEGGTGLFLTAIIRDTSERTQLEDWLRLREAQLAEAQALAKLGSWDLDLRANEMQWSDEMFRILGLDAGGDPPSLELMAGRLATAGEPPEWHQAIKEGRSFSGLHRVPGEDGQEVAIHLQGKPVFDARGQLVGAAGTAQDLTDHLSLEKRREGAEERFRQAFENAPIGMVLGSADGILSRVNEAFCTMTGYAPEALEGKHFRHITHPADVEQSEREMGQLLRGERRSVHSEKRYAHAEGGCIDTRTSISLVMDPEGQPLMIAQIEDVTAAKRAKQALDETKERFQAILDNAPVAVTMKDLDGRFMLVSRMAAAMSGLKREEMLGKTVSELFPGQSAIDHVIATDREVIAAKAPKSAEFAFETPDGLTTLLMEAFPVWGSDGEISAVAAVSVDISERIRFENENRRLGSELEGARRLEALGGLAGGVAHDFNNLLAVILNYAVLAREEVADTSVIAEELDEIRNAAERAAELTRKLLAFSRQERLESRVLDLNSVVADSEWLLRRTLGEDIELWVELGDSLWPVEANATQLENVLLNLAVNAAHAMPQGGTLSIRTENVTLTGAGSPVTPPGRYVRLSVSDTGSGMTEEEAARAFEPFFTTKPTGEGTGLGLATVYGAVRQAGGTVDLRTDGRGTRVTTYLPASDDEVTSSPPPAPATRAGDGQDILVVEDEPSVRRMVHRILARAGYSVREASPMEALEACASPDTPVHLLLTDVVMPSISGSELAARARELCPDLRVLFMSGYLDEAKLASPIHEMGPLLGKPFSPEQLLHAIEGALERGLGDQGAG